MTTITITKAEKFHEMLKLTALVELRKEMHGNMFTSFKWRMQYKMISHRSRAVECQNMTIPESTHSKEILITLVSDYWQHSEGDGGCGQALKTKLIQRITTLNILEGWEDYWMPC